MDTLWKSSVDPDDEASYSGIKPFSRSDEVADLYEVNHLGIGYTQN